MKRQFLLAFLLLSLALGVSAQRKKVSKVEKNLREHVSYLASDQLEGRRTGEKGATFAAGYIANLFARYKLTAGYTDGSGKSFLQPFEYVSGVELGERNMFSVNGKEVGLRTDWMPIGFSPDVNISGSQIIFAGFGITADDLQYDDYAGLDVTDNIVLVLAGTPDSGNPHSGFGRFGIHAKANIAKENGAKGLILISNEESFADEKLALRYDQTLGETAVPAIVISRDAAGRLLDTDGEGLKEIEKWVAMRTETPDNIRIRLTNLPPLRTDLAVDLTKKKAEAYNVIGIVPGKDPALKNEAIVIGAHYDHLGRGGEGSLAPNSNDVHHGADDNASGTSSLVELARQFRKAKDNRRTLIFIAFGGEEAGLIGSKAYVNNPVFPLENTIAMINMDMVGRLTGDKLTVGGIGTAEVWKDLVERLNSRGNIPVIGSSGNGSGDKANLVNASSTESGLFNLQLNQDGFGPSDHSSFYGKKIPVLFLFTGTHSDYHKPSDTAEKINYEGLLKINSFVAEIVRYLDRAAARPEYKVAESAGMQGARRGFNVSLGTIPSYSDSGNDGLVIDGVRNDSPADKAGLKGGDKIVSLAGKEIRNISDYMFVLGEMKAGEEYDVIVMRGEEKLTLKIVPEGR